jgi:hypothetical protein
MVVSRFACGAACRDGGTACPGQAPAPRVSTFSPLPLGGEGPGGEGVNALKPQITQRCPQVSREGAARGVVVAQCFQRRDVKCKRTGAGLPPPHPARPG